jgi:hypothetical protein
MFGPESSHASTHQHNSVSIAWSNAASLRRLFSNSHTKLGASNSGSGEDDLKAIHLL